MSSNAANGPVLLLFLFEVTALEGIQIKLPV